MDDFSSSKAAGFVVLVLAGMLVMPYLPPPVSKPAPVFKLVNPPTLISGQMYTLDYLGVKSGDTIKVNVHLPWNGGLLNETLKLDYDAPELTEPGGKEAAEALDGLLKTADGLWVTPGYGKGFANGSRDDHGRLLGHVMVDVDGIKSWVRFWMQDHKHCCH